ncbi:hypothetical protein F4821DRAFT_109792 [Hypoxylon rubiginosum]|uniref:Uncharacterized protein n=1 Tax=Hypoxylon rubiginosum TaxID=110542 RepID=A0ACC0DIP3_9PEZI|nr:hypothetical protein F4821DRAFT_109792 [Hypoxylon rubiginosum]
MDPGTSLAVVSLALQVTHGLISYYKFWTHADGDIAEIQRSLLSLANMFAQLDIVLKTPNLQEHIVSIIRLAMNNCDSTVQGLQKRLEKLQQHNSPQKLKNKLNRRILYIFYHQQIEGLQSQLNKLRSELRLAIEVLNLDTTARSIDELRNELTVFKLKFEETNNSNYLRAHEKTIEERRSSIVKWLASYDISHAHLSAYERREPDTGRWLLESSCYDRWRSSESQFLWLVGDGKNITWLGRYSSYVG